MPKMYAMANEVSSSKAETLFVEHGATFPKDSHNSSNVATLHEKGQYSFELPLLPELSHFDKSFAFSIFTYCVVFVIATSANILAFISLWTKFKRVEESRILLLLLNLTCADLIVCCTLLPTEIIWRLTIHWWGGNFLCKLTQFMCTFGLYLSSLVLICVSVDRFVSIMFPMTVLKIGAYRRIKVMLAMAWIFAGIFSIPQAIFFSAESYTDYPDYKQCVTNHFEYNFRDVKIYSIFSLTVMYFIPLAVILFTYTSIFLKLARKSHERSPVNVSSRFYNVSQYVFRGRNLVSIHQCHSTETPSSPVMFHLRCNSNAGSSMSKAKTRSLVMTILIVAAFVVCWTPYAFMNLWYMLDWKRATRVDPLVQDALFLMAVANSCINPVIYSRFSNNVYISSHRRTRQFCLPG